MTLRILIAASVLGVAALAIMAGYYLGLHTGV